MKLADALREMAHRNGWRQIDFARNAGYKAVSVITAPIKRGDMYVSTLTKLANAAGYDLMLVRRNPLNHEYPITIDQKEEEDNGEA